LWRIPNGYLSLKVGYNGEIAVEKLVCDVRRYGMPKRVVNTRLRVHRLHGTGKRGEGDRRSEFERDYSRIIHAPSFRLLEGRAQLFGVGAGDYYRTRLTHTLEVAQIARNLASRLLRRQNSHKPAVAQYPGLVINPLVVECAALAHDLGQPPYGQKGEDALNNLLTPYGCRFDGHAQALRVVMVLEKRYERQREANAKGRNVAGHNLTAAVLLAMNKYPKPFPLEVPPAADAAAVTDVISDKGVYPTEYVQIKELRDAWSMPDTSTTLEAQIVHLADDIAYSTHDLEDGAKAGKIQLRDLNSSNSRLKDEIAAMINKYDLGDERAQWSDAKENIAEIVGRVLTEYEESWRQASDDTGGNADLTYRELRARWIERFANSVDIIADRNWERVAFVAQDGSEDVTRYREMIVLKRLAWVAVVRDMRIQQLQWRSQQVVEGLWDMLWNRQEDSAHWHLLPPELQGSQKPRQGMSYARLLSDYIAGMTDAYASHVYGELTGFNHPGSIYDRS